MKIKIRSLSQKEERDVVAEFIELQYVSFPKMNIRNGNLVQEMQPPQFLIFAAFKDQFGLVPLADAEPVWDDEIATHPLTAVTELKTEEEVVTEAPPDVVELTPTSEDIVELEIAKS